MRPNIVLALVLDWAAAYASASSLDSNAPSFLGDALVRKDPLKTVLDHTPVSMASCEPSVRPTGPIEMTMCDYETIESVNPDLYEQLHALVETPFFRYFRVDLYRDCPFWDENSLCVNEDCRIVTVDESDIPEPWRAKALSKLQSSSQENRTTLPGCYYRDSDFCFLDDDTEGDYVDLALNPERFTGYAGTSTARIWQAIYQENCFGESELNLMNEPSKAAVTMPGTLTGPLHPDDANSNEGEQCVEKRAYYKIISGLHASISTHICLENFNQRTGNWGPDLQCFVNRVASHPERLQYIYFNTVLMLRAVARLGPYLNAYDYCASATHDEHALTLSSVQSVVELAKTAGKFDETVLFAGANAAVLKEEFKQHFRNVTRIMDCVGCDKCRLWGKVQTTGVATALKVLFEMDEKALDPRLNANLLSRTEVVALLNTLHRFSESLHATELFRKMWRETSESESASLKRDAENALRPPMPSNDTYVEPTDILGRIKQFCREGTRSCVGFLMGLVEAVTSLFRLSGKEDGPHAEL
ncbi:endoplasmic oxidoreductin [Peniophora sp. CONT]|nr:endoplasmic oxidoreductin [Peniophora sp. CONT]